MINLLKKNSDMGALDRKRELLSQPKVGRTTQTFGEISRHLNRLCWTIPRFHGFKKDANLIIYSPKIFIGDRQCHLFARPWYGLDPRTGKCQFLAGACTSSSQLNFLLLKNPDLKVRLGITGRNVEHSVFGIHYGTNDTVQEELLGYSEFDNNKDLWLPEGNLHLFMVVEGTDEKPAAEIFPKTPTEIGK